jgi:hypothetical protein
MNTYMNEDLFADLTAEIKQVRAFYNIPTLEHVPDSELSLLGEAHAGDLVRKGKHVGIVFDVISCGGNEALAIVFNSGRTTTHTRKAL